MSNEPEREVKQLVRNNVVPLRKAEVNRAADPAATDFASLVEQMTGRPIGEIERLIAIFQCMRDIMQDEGERVRREVARFAGVSRLTMKSISEVNDTLAPWEASMHHRHIKSR